MFTATSIEKFHNRIYETFCNVIFTSLTLFPKKFLFPQCLLSQVHTFIIDILISLPKTLFPLDLCMVDIHLVFKFQFLFYLLLQEAFLTSSCLS